MNLIMVGEVVGWFGCFVMRMNLGRVDCFVVEVGGGQFVVLKWLMSSVLVVVLIFMRVVVFVGCVWCILMGVVIWW